MRDLYATLSEEIRVHGPGTLKLLDRGTSDLVLDQLEVLMEGKVGPKPSEEEWRSWVKDGNERAARGQPPGFRDAGKASSELPEGAAGDYVVWRQGTEEAARRDLDLLFVTGDEKDDWWWRYRSELLGPNIELVQEFASRCGRQLYMMRPIDLLKRGSVLEVAVRGGSVDDAERVGRDASLMAIYGRDKRTWSEIVDAGLQFLIECARQGKTTTYSELNSALETRTGIAGFDFNLPSERAGMGHLLALIVDRNLPDTNLIISALVTYAGKNEAGPGFYGLAQELGMLSRGASQTVKWDFWTEQVKALFEHYSKGSE